MVSVNELGLELFQELVEDAEWLNVAYHEHDNGARIVDCGVNATGSYGAGYYFTAICMGGLGNITFRQDKVGKIPMTFIDISTDFPAISCLGSQKAGWSIKYDGFFAMGSGPARALSLQPKETYERIGYEDESDAVVICLEADRLPSESVMQMIADKCHVPVNEVCALVAPTSSLVGSIQVAGRCVETAIYKLNELGFDTRKIISAAGPAPIPPVRGPKLAMGVTNDAAIYHGQIYLTMNAPEIVDYLEQIPSCASNGYGQPFNDIFMAAGHDFFKIDKSLFSPAEVVINEVSSGKVYHVGKIDPEVTLKSFGLS